MAQSGKGRIEIFEDFTGPEVPIATTTDFENLGPFLAGGEGIEDTDVGIVRLDSDGLSGVAQFISGNTDLDTTAVFTGKMFDAALMGTLVMEVRVRFPDLDDKQVFIGFANENDDDIDATTDIIDAAATTVLTLNGSNFCGFCWSSQLTEDEMWHSCYKGGATTGVVLSTTNEMGVDAVAGEFNIVRVEVDPNGNARFYVDGVLKQSVNGAMSTTTDVAAVCAVSANTTELGVMEVDYILIRANRDWTI